MRFSESWGSGTSSSRNSPHAPLFLISTFTVASPGSGSGGDSPSAKRRDVGAASRGRKGVASCGVVDYQKESADKSGGKGSGSAVKKSSKKSQGHLERDAVLDPKVITQ